MTVCGGERGESQHSKSRCFVFEDETPCIIFPLPAPVPPRPLLLIHMDGGWNWAGAWTWSQKYVADYQRKYNNMKQMEFQGLTKSGRMAGWMHVWRGDEDWLRNKEGRPERSWRMCRCGGQEMRPFNFGQAGARNGFQSIFGRGPTTTEKDQWGQEWSQGSKTERRFSWKERRIRMVSKEM